MTDRADKKRKSTSSKPKRPRCKECGRPIHVPNGWSIGPAVRRHYWAKHPERMQRDKRS